jgi:hypothetical protein
MTRRNRMLGCLSYLGPAELGDLLRPAPYALRFGCVRRVGVTACLPYAGSAACGIRAASRGAW